MVPSLFVLVTISETERRFSGSRSMMGLNTWTGTPICGVPKVMSRVIFLPSPSFSRIHLQTSPPWLYP